LRRILKFERIFEEISELFVEQNICEGISEISEEIQK